MSLIESFIEGFIEAAARTPREKRPWWKRLFGMAAGLGGVGFVLMAYISVIVGFWALMAYVVVTVAKYAWQ